ncbi:MAG: SIMPL domain-containing protein [Rikenellaceae bacterium]
MKKLLLLLVASVVAFGASAQEGSIQSFVEVTGKAEKQVAPDRFELRIIIDEAATKGKLSVQALEADMVAALKELKIDCEKDLTMSYVSSDYVKRKGALSTATYILRLEDGALLQSVYSKLGEMDITSLKLLKSYNSQQDKYEAEVRSAALLNARDVAQSMAATYGQEIGECFYMSYNVSYASPNMSDVVMVGYGSSTRKELTGAYAPLSFEKQTISARVMTKFILRVAE